MTIEWISISCDFVGNPGAAPELNLIVLVAFGKFCSLMNALMYTYIFIYR